MGIWALAWIAKLQCRIRYCVYVGLCNLPDWVFFQLQIELSDRIAPSKTRSDIHFRYLSTG
jgi:hypothetical protein